MATTKKTTKKAAKKVAKNVTKATGSGKGKLGQVRDMVNKAL
jgi:hypothetical protein